MSAAHKIESSYKSSLFEVDARYEREPRQQTGLFFWAQIKDALGLKNEIC
ncbi:hypothetical protein IMCC3088_1538 [Aequoribacter fuscus]|uniref:Uncharacterized protein n=1 Tax=Aequoribacter fuscus TaxID=2518989 RepID=F3KYE3_9GAMM|nr:hypothetical protein IMCC3088_1538 [Aequoribacter fuscus]